MNPMLTNKTIRHCLALLGMQCIASLSSFALDPNLPPSGNFDMSIWRLTLPVNSSGGFSGTPLTIGQPQLSQGYENAPYFHTGDDGAMVFSVPYNGAAGGTSSSPRSEHREIYPNNDQHNWLPRDNSGVHVMNAMVAVENVGNGGVVCIGQIHTDDSTAGYAAIMLFFDNSVSPSRVSAKIKTSASKISGNQFLYFPNILLGDIFSYQLRIDGSPTSCVFSVTVNGVTQTFDMAASDSRYVDELFYYKAGAYYTGTVTGQTAVVSFYQLNVAHGSAALPLAITTTTLPGAQQNVSYSQQLSASGGTTPYGWSVSGGSLPTGLSMSSSGAITGTPTATGTFNFTASVSDAASASDTQALSIVVSAGSSQVAAPVFTPAGGAYGSPVSVALSTATSGAQMRFTTNGTNPTSTTGTLYSGPATVSSSMTVKAIAFKSGMLDSSITTAAYTIGGGANVVPAIIETNSVSADPAYWSVVSDSNASGGQALKALVSSTSAPPSGGSLVYTFTLNSAATVYFHVKGLAGNANANESWVRINNGSWNELNYTWTGSGYKWKNVSASLPAGTHTFEVRCNEVNTQIDQVAATLSSSNPN